MKKTLLITALLLLSFCGFGQNKMPYIIQYQMQGDTIYHNLQSVEMIHIDSTGQEFVHGNGSDLIPLSGLDTVYIFRDEFRRYTGQMADWDEVLFSTEQIYFYKGNEETGLPKYLFNVIITDSIPNGYFVFTEFDDEGYPEYMNFNDSCFMVIDSVYGEYYDAVVIAKDMSSFTMDSVRMEEAPSSIKERYQSLICSGKALTPGSGQYAVEVSNQYLGSLHMAVGGTIVVFVGCSMLVPGVNIAVGATIALAGAAEFTSGALLAAHATDQIISDGSHTQGFEGASKVFGFLSNLTGGPIHALLDFLIEEGLTQGIHYSLYNYFEIEAAKQRAQRIRNLKLTTGRATLLDLNSYSVQLWGYVREKMQSNDYFGIFISDKRDALEVMNCMLSESNNPGAFTCDFDALEPMKDYYYRAYYYATEFANLDTVNPWIVSKIKSFKMPGVITLVHEQGNYSNSYWLHGKFQDVANQPTHTVGFCYSYTNEEPTYDDEIMEQTVYDNGEFSGHLFMNSSYDVCYYRAYAFINGEIAYGEVMQLGGSEERECLLSIYNATNGTNWTNQYNWGSSRPVSEWYGVDTDENGHVVSLSLNNNNLSGSLYVSCLPYLNYLNISNNGLSSISIYNTSISNIELSNCIINYGSMNIDNIPSIEISNIPEMGHISCSCDSLLVTNCQFGSIGYPFSGASCSKAIIDNCYMYNCSLSSSILVFRNSTTYNTWYCNTSQKLVIENSYCSTICSGDFYDNTLIILINATLWRSNWDENSLITVTRTIRGSQWYSLFGD